MGLKRKIGELEKGKKNTICDVPGVRVGHVTLSDGPIQTGVTAILPAEGSLFREKVQAGLSVLNGYGKSVGLVQVEELGTLESPLLLTNTLSVGTALTALVEYMLEEHQEIGREAGTVNAVVMECNDGRINDIRGLHVSKEDALSALDLATEDMEEGAVGAGRGMVCFGLKGGIGSSSRVLTIDKKEYSLGAMVLSNFGRKGALRIEGQAIDGFSVEEGDEKGSIIMIVATDLPLSSRQLTRLSRRSSIALGRVGSIMGHGSGDICLAFSTANRIPHTGDDAIRKVELLHEEYMEKVFIAGIEAIEEAIYSSLYHAEGMVDLKGERVHGLREYWDE